MNYQTPGNRTRIDAAEVHRQIEALFLQFPELKEDEVLRADTLEGETDLHEVLRALEHKRREATVMCIGLERTIDEMAARHARFERREDGIRSMMLALMQTADLRKAELPEATLSVYKGPAKVMISDERQLPAEFVRVRTEPDKKLIKEALATGENIPGVAGMSNAPDCLKVMVK